MDEVLKFVMWLGLEIGVLVKLWIIYLVMVILFDGGGV